MSSQSITFFPVGYTFTILEKNEYKELTFIIEDIHGQHTVNVRVKREMAQGVMEFIESQYRDDLVDTQRSIELEHKLMLSNRELRTATRSRDRYKSIADKKHRVYVHEYEMKMARVKAMEIEQDVYLKCNDILKNFLKGKHDLIQQAKYIMKLNISPEQKISDINALLQGDAGLPG